MSRRKFKARGKATQKMISFICYARYNYKFDQRIRSYYQQQNYSSMLTLLQSGISMSDYKLFASATKLISKFFLYNDKIISDSIIENLRQYSKVQDVKNACINVMNDFNSGDKHTWLFNELCILLETNGSNFDNLPLTSEEAISLLVNILDEDDFEKFYYLFSESDNQKEMAQSFIDNATLGSDVMIFRKPKIQNLFIAFRDIVFGFDDDELTANMLSYCLFFRTRDIFTTDEVLESATTFSNDAFQQFIQNFEDYLWEYRETFVKSLVSGIDKKRVVQFIKKKHHPREKKLIQLINDRYDELDRIEDDD